MQFYKLTDQNMRTRGGYQWALNEWRETSGEGDLCGSGWLHCYRGDPLIATFLNPIHAAIVSPRTFEIETRGRGRHDGPLKSGYASMRLTRELELPAITTTQRVAVAIMCAVAVHSDPIFCEWAQNWLSGEDRSPAAARAAEAASARAAWEAARAARAAARAAREAARAAARAAWEAEAAATAARAAAWAAQDAIDLVAILRRAVEEY
jgi:hypothetical protein